jgi:predicted transcriptional regulator
MNTRVLTAHIPLDLAEQIDAIAQRTERPKGWIVKQALAAWVADAQARHQLTLEALADVDAGRVIDHAAIETWVASLDKRKSKRR